MRSGLRRPGSAGITPASPGRGAAAPAVDETIDMIFEKDNAVEEGFNRWSINGVSYPMNDKMVPASFHLKAGRDGIESTCAMPATTSTRFIFTVTALS